MKNQNHFQTLTTISSGVGVLGMITHDIVKEEEVQNFQKIYNVIHVPPLSIAYKTQRPYENLAV